MPFLAFRPFPTAESQASFGVLCTLFKDFETIFAFSLIHFNTDHYFGQFLVKLVVFLGDDELIFLLLCETDDFSIV